MTEYIYQPLQSVHREFRLLEVLPSTDNCALLRCRLRHSSISERPEYETISYVWGKSKARATVEVDEATLAVPASADEAVRCMRLPDRPRMIWIDAICIDQGNIEERGRQVSMMGDIYRNSTGNLVFLGQGDESSRAALRDIDGIVSEIEQDTDDLRLLKDVMCSSGPGVLSSSGLRAHVDYEALLSFFSLPWFTRLWVFQEVTLAPNNTCFLGPLQCNVTKVLRAARWLSYKKVYIPYSLGGCRGRDNAAVMWEFADKSHGPSRDLEPLLVELLDFCSLLEVSEQRDRVFGMLGLKQWRNGLPMLLTPDYQKPTADVFRDAARYALEEDRTLFIWRNISWRSTADSDSALTWVPPFYRSFSDDEDPATLATIFRCHGVNEKLSSAEFNNSLDPDILEVSGFNVCDVNNVSSIYSLDVTNKSKALHHLEDWLSEVNSLLDRVALSEKTLETVIVAGVNHGMVKATDKDISAFAEFERLLLLENRWPTPLGSVSLEVDESELSASQYAHSFVRACDNRRVFVTKSGYIGLGPKIMRDGDVVVVLYGGHTPYILRPSGNEYRLLGECYAHGIMYGEAMEQHKKSGRPDMWFRIR